MPRQRFNSTADDEKRALELRADEKKAAEAFARRQEETDVYVTKENGEENVVDETVELKRLTKKNEKEIAAKRADRKRKIEEANAELAAEPAKKSRSTPTTPGPMDGQFQVRFQDRVEVVGKHGSVVVLPLAKEHVPKETRSQAPSDAGSIMTPMAVDALPKRAPFKPELEPISE